MTVLTSLWMPILLSAVLVFVVSSIIHMAPLWHRGDYPALPGESRVADALRPMNLPPGDYMLPRAASNAEMSSPEFQAKMKSGPVIVMTVLPNGPWNMGRNLSLWFAYALVVSLFAAYLTSRALAPGASYLEVFRFAGTTAFAGYSLGLWQMTIWYHRGVALTLRSTFDGFIYACLTAGALGWLWP